MLKSSKHGHPQSVADLFLLVVQDLKQFLLKNWWKQIHEQVSDAAETLEDKSKTKNKEWRIKQFANDLSQLFVSLSASCDC